MPWPPEDPDMWAVEARFGKKIKKVFEPTRSSEPPEPYLQCDPKTGEMSVLTKEKIKEITSASNSNTNLVDDVDPGIVTFKSGASRSKLMSWFTFVPRYFIQRIADVFRYGAKKYGIRNWQKGDQDFIDEIPDHIINHVYEYLEEVNSGGTGKDKEDHLANIGCNLVMLMHFQKQGKFPQRTQG